MVAVAAAAASCAANVRRSVFGSLNQLYWPTFFLGAWALTSGSKLTPWLLLNLAGWPVAHALSVVAHEAGHALMGAAIGFSPFRVQLGGGPVLKEIRLGPTRVELRGPPMSGRVMVSTSSMILIRARMWLLYAAGPAVTTGLFWLALTRSGGLEISSLAQRAAPWELLGFVNAILACLSLYPGHINGVATDGRNLLLIVPWVPVAKFESLLIIQELHQASVALGEHDFARARALSERAAARAPASEHLRFLGGVIDLMEGKVAEARLIFNEFLEHPEPQIAALSRNNLAWGSFIERKAERLEEALAFSEAALQALPRSGPVQGTRGAVLYWAGRNEEADASLRSAFEANEQPHMKALNACLLSMVCSRADQRAEAGEWLARAESLDPRCVLLSEARAISAPA